MRKFNLYVDGQLHRAGYECMGKFDVLNELFPRVEEGRRWFAKLSDWRDLPNGGLEAKLLGDGRIFRVESADD